MSLSIDELFLEQKRFFQSGQTRDLSFRRKKLCVLRDQIRANETRILEALKTDLGKEAAEAYATEIGLVYEEIRYALKHLRKWVKPKKARVPWIHKPARARIEYQPKGVVLIIAPWNYPFQLAMTPLVGAIAAGNCAIIKPSELAPATSRTILKVINEGFLKEHLHVVEGGIEISQAMLELKWDHIFFTGSTQVGRAIMAAAAKNLVPVTLELGGKSPCLVDESATLDLAARRIVFGKFMNAGQTCVAPDYVFVHKSVSETLVAELKKEIQRAFGENPLTSPEMGKIINERHFLRLKSYLKDAPVVFGGRYDERALKMEPTLVINPPIQHPLLKEEIFGPILPILTYEDLDDALDRIELNREPLALYLFSNQRRVKKRVIRDVPCGGVCINHTNVHLAVPELPFGGVGESGLGSYHGFFSFETFSHRKSILKKGSWPDFSLWYRPYQGRLKWFRWFIR